MLFGVSLRGEKWGREGGRERGREEGRKGGREGGRKGGRCGVGEFSVPGCHSRVLKLRWTIDTPIILKE